MTLLDEVKASLRISHTTDNSLIEQYIEECKAELFDQGIEPDDDDPSVRMAIRLYANWMYDHNGKGDRYHDLYLEKIYTMAKQTAHAQESDDE